MFVRAGILPFCSVVMGRALASLLCIVLGPALIGSNRPALVRDGCSPLEGSKFAFSMGGPVALAAGSIGTGAWEDTGVDRPVLILLTWRSFVKL